MVRFEGNITRKLFSKIRLHHQELLLVQKNPSTKFKNEKKNSLECAQNFVVRFEGNLTRKLFSKIRLHHQELL